jgi:alpha-1,2-mannosyltransferase
MPQEAHRYWIDGLFDDPSRVGGVNYVGNQSLQGLLARTLGLDTHGVKPYWLAAALLVALLAVPLSLWAYRRGEELLGVAVTALFGLLVSPISWSHHWVWMAVFLVAGGVLLHSRRAPWWGWLLAAVPYLLCVAWPTVAFGDLQNHTVLPNGLIWSVPYNNNAENDWHGLQLLTGNLYPLLGVLLLVGLGLFFRRTRTAGVTTAVRADDAGSPRLPETASDAHQPVP